MHNLINYEMLPAQLELETRKVAAMEIIAQQLRKLASPTPDEIRQTLQQRIDTAVFLDAKRPESTPLN